ncbi:DMT family transporter [soil metagenome]
MKFSKYHLAVLALIVTNIIWGASIPILKWSLESVPPFTFAFIRFFLSALLLLPFTIHRLKITRHDAISLFVLAFTGFFLHIGLLLVGLTISTSLNSSIITAAAPIFLILGSVILFKERVKKKVILGSGISLLGVLLIIIRPLFDKGIDGSIIGNILFVLGTLSFVTYTILIKEYSTHLRTTTVTFYMFAFATVIFFPFSLMESSQHNILQLLDTRAVIGILFGTIFTSIIGYLFYNYAIRLVKASEVGVFLYMDPIITALVAVPLLHEKITTIFLLGTLLVFVGIFVAEKRIHYHPIHLLFKKD